MQFFPPQRNKKGNFKFDLTTFSRAIALYLTWLYILQFWLFFSDLQVKHLTILNLCLKILTFVFSEFLEKN